MRWIWIDAFLEFESGRYAKAVKNISLAEDYLHDHFPAFPIFPPSLMIEGMAQTAGILVGEARGFEENVILAKIRRVSIDGLCLPGDQLTYGARIDSLEEAAAAVTCDIARNGEEIGQAQLLFSHVNRSASAAGLPEHNFVFDKQFTSLLHTYRLRSGKGHSIAEP